LLAPLCREEPGVVDGHRRLTRNQRDQIEIVLVVCFGLVRQDLHYTDCPVVIGEGRCYLALYFTLGRHLKNRTLPPALRLRRDERDPGLKHLGDGLRSVGEIEDALAFPFLAVHHNAACVELPGYGICDHQREAGRIHHRRHRLIDLAICFVQGDRGRDGLLHRRDRGKPRSATLELLDELSRQ
jgi:hypothetical protein